MNYYLGVLNKYAVFSGRAQRKEYWYFFLINLIISIAFTVLDIIIGSFSPEIGIGILSGIYSLIILVPSLAVSVRRLHDTNHNGWFLLLNLIPIVGAIILIVYLTKDSQPNENKYGPNPKGTGEVEKISI